MSKETEARKQTGFEIAVIGMAGRFPGAKNIAEFWENLKNGIESLSFITSEELAAAGLDPRLLDNPDFVKTKGGVLEDTAYFDAAFFDYTSLEAQVMDPQTRVFHECAWEALENAGYAPHRYNGLIGIYAGASLDLNWQALSVLSGKRNELGELPASLLTDKDYLSTRLAYKLNLKGPAVVVQSACSTSLTAIHTACRALLTGECQMALAGGATVSTADINGYLYQEGMIMSPDGHCRAFDARAGGTASGNGAGIVLLKRLKSAAADGDNIYAVLLGSAVNNDGMDKVGFTAPGVAGQADVIKAARHVARVEPGSITYIEAHGTGTLLGDPIEIKALTLAFNTDKKGFCAVGSVKTNVGHLGSAAGAAGVIKTVLALKHRLIPPSLNFENPHPDIDFDSSPFYVNREAREWKNDRYPLRAGVSAFGIGGTNAHIILEEAPARDESPAAREWQLLLLSAKTQTALDTITGNLAAYLKENPAINLADVAYTLQVGREAFKYRKMLVCPTPGTAEAVKALSSSVSRKVFTFFSGNDNRFVVFMFAGLGSQYVNMGLELYRKEPVFAKEMDRCFEILSTLAEENIKEILYPGQAGGETGRINQSGISQLVIFIFEYSLARLLIHWGITPHAMMGYSFGEYTAACVSGVFSLADALKLVAVRSRLIQKLPSGGMLSVPLPAAELVPLLNGELSLAIDNGPSCVIAGAPGHIDAFEGRMKERKVICMRVQASRALHSKEMAPILAEFREQVAQLDLKKPEIPYISNVTGTWISVEEAADPGYWVRHLQETVQFAEGIRELLKEERVVFIEIGPGHDLSSLLMRHIQMANEPEHRLVNLVRPAQKKVSDMEYLSSKIGQLWLYGQAVDWQVFYAAEKRHRVPLPTYPFERQRYWLEAGPLKPAVKKTAGDMADWFYIPSWKRTLPADRGRGESLKKANWLVFIGKHALGLQLSEQLKQTGGNVATVKQGTHFEKRGPGEYRIDPKNEDDYHALLRDINLQLPGEIPTKILHLLGVTGSGHPRQELTVESVNNDLDMGFYSLIYMARAIAGQNWSEPCEVVVVTDDMQDITGQENLCPGKAAVLGPLKVIPQEYPNIVCRSIDISLPAASVEELLDEFMAEKETPDTIAAYRSGYRWVQTFEPERLDKPLDVRQLRDKGVYLVTGGLGNIGLILAKSLAESVKARLVLTGRSHFPAGDEWEQWLAVHEAEDPISRKIKKLRKIEELGAEVMVFSADTADREQMEHVIARAEERFGSINGIIHSAGIIGGKTFSAIEDIGKEECRQQFQAKIYGLLVLEQLSRGKELDFCWLMSSIGAVLGGLGFVAYAAGNAFMDAFVGRYKRLNAAPWLSVNWDGMAAHETADAFRRILSLGKAHQVVVSSGGNLVERIHRWINLQSLRRESLPVEQEKRVYRPRPYLSDAYAPPRSPVEKKLIEIWQNFFGIEKIGIYDDFFELGGDSLKAITIIAKIHKGLNVKLSVSRMFKCLNISQLAQHIEKSVKDRFVAIESAEAREYYPLSSAQKRMYMIHDADPENTAYNVTQVFPLDNRANKEKLEETFNKLINRHESLRSSIRIVHNQPVQVTHNPGEVTCRVVSYNAAEDEVNRLLEDFVKPFDLSRAPFFRVGLLNYGDSKNALIVDLHHIISDGVSSIVFKQDFLNLYGGGELPPLKLQYKDYACWQDSDRCRELIKKQEDYWLQEYEGELPVLNLPIDFQRPRVYTLEGDSIRFFIGKKETEALEKIARSQDATLFMILLAIFYIFLWKITRQEDIIVGIPTVGRGHADLDHIVGIFINTLALRTRVMGEKTFTEFLDQVKIKNLEAFDNQEYPFENLVEKIAPIRDLGRQPLFDVMFGFQNFFQQSRDLVETGEPDPPDRLNYKDPVTKFDLTLVGAEAGDGLFFSFQYSVNLFRRETIERFKRYFEKIVSIITAGADAGKLPALSALDIIGAEEKQRLLYRFNRTGVYYPGDKTIHRLFEEQVEKRPDAAAVVFNDSHLGYGELDKMAGRLARVLREKGVKKDTIVGMVLGRSLEMITAVLGILKAGGAYLPIDPGYPGQRIQYMLNDSRVELLVTAAGLMEKFGELSIVNCQLLMVNEIPTGCPSINNYQLDQADLAYIIYTSGTTGKPKGALIEHGNVVRLLFNEENLFDFSSSDTWTMFHSYGFDFSVWEMYGALLYGSKLIVVPKRAARDPGRFLKVLTHQKVTVLNQTPTAFYQLITEALKIPGRKLLLRYVIFGGEALKPARLKEWQAAYPGVQLINMYGITETTVHVTYKEITGEEIQLNRSNIGNPIPTLSSYVMDRDLKLMPTGAAGELCVGGAGVCRGYLNKPQLTHEKFVENPYSEGERLYRSGDLAKITGTTGEMEYLGRVDQQVKIRGFRIEPAEIESRLSKHNDIKEAIVMAREDKNGGRYLCAYMVSEKPLSVPDLRNYLAKDLPDYMIPAYFVPLDNIPLTANKKVDRKALPAPVVTAGEAYAAPRDHIERKMAEIWELVLGVKQVGIKDNLFEIGGDSIKSIQIAARMNEAGYKLDTRDLFQHPTIAELAPRIKRKDRIADQSAVCGVFPLLPIQRRFFSSDSTHRHHFNQALMLHALERLEADMVKILFSKLQGHHDALRITYKKKNGDIVQENHGLDYPLSLEIYDFCNRENALQLMEQKANQIQASIDLEKGPLMKLGLFYLDDGTRLLITVHHLVIDGISWRIMFEDIGTLYRQYAAGKPLELPLKTDSYKVWAEALVNFADSKGFLKQANYWAELEAAAVPEISRDFEEEGGWLKDIKDASATLNREETEGLLTKTNEAFGTEINDILITALGRAVREIYGHDRLLIALEGHGREQIMEGLDITRTIGWFTSVYPVLLDISHDNNLARQIIEIKETLHQVPGKGTGHTILKYITKEKNKTGITFKLNPQISFNYFGQFDEDVKRMTAFSVAKESAGNPVSLNRKLEYQLNISGMVTGKRLVFSISYSKKQFRAETVKRLLKVYKTKLLEITAYCRQREKKRLTPCDLTYNRLSIDDLEFIYNKLSGKNIEDIYRLSPMQEGMYFQSLYDKSASMYFEEVSYRLHGEMDMGFVKKSLDQLVKRHDILRTVFIHEGVDQLVQVVLSDRPMDFHYEDIRGLAEEDRQKKYIQEFKEKGRQTPFSLAEDILMRVAVLQVGQAEYEFIWSHHHILMDGWCVGILISEFWEFYNSFLENRTYRLPEVKPYRHYIQWLESQGEEAAKNYWQRYLEGYGQQVAVPKREAPGMTAGGYKNREAAFVLAKEKTTGLNNLAKHNRVTMNSIIQAVWGILLNKYNGKQDTVFGAVVSARPSEIQGVESMVGLFINTIPVRVTYDEETTFKQLLRDVQQDTVASGPYQYYPLAKIQGEHPLKQKLLDHNLAFENYPLEVNRDDVIGKSSKSTRGSQIGLVNVEAFEQLGHDLNIAVDPSEKLRITIKYNANIYDPSLVNKIPFHFERIFDQVLKDDNLYINGLTLLQDDEKLKIHSDLQKDMEEIVVDLDF